MENRRTLHCGEIADGGFCQQEMEISTLSGAQSECQSVCRENLSTPRKIEHFICIRVDVIFHRKLTNRSQNVCNTISHSLSLSTLLYSTTPGLNSGTRCLYLDCGAWQSLVCLLRFLPRNYRPSFIQHCCIIRSSLSHFILPNEAKISLNFRL